MWAIIKKRKICSRSWLRSTDLWIIWAQHASTAPLCYLSDTLLAFTLQYNVKSQYNHTHLSKKEDICNLHIISRLGKNKYTC